MDGYFYDLAGNPAPQPYVKPYDGEGDGYTSDATHVRIVDEGYEDYTWVVDGVDGAGRFTEDVRSFATLEDAQAFVPEFIADMRRDGTTFESDSKGA